MDITSTVLLISSDVTCIELIGRAFENNSNGVSVSIVRSIKEARSYLAKSSVDLAIGDYLLADGKISEILSTGPGKCSCPVLVMTEDGDVQAIVEVMEAGAVDCLIKSEKAISEIPGIVERILGEVGGRSQSKVFDSRSPDSDAKQLDIPQLRRFHNQQSAIVGLAVEKVVSEGHFRAAVRKVTETASEVLGVERVSLWLLHNDDKVLRCVDLFERSTGEHSKGEILEVDKYPNYFRALNTERVITAHDACTDIRTKEFADSYFLPLGIVSMLDGVIRVSGKVVGVVCHEHVEKSSRVWATDEMTFVGNIADLVARVIINSRRRQAEEQLRQAHSNLKQIFHATVPMCVIGMEGKILMANNTFYSYVGSTKSQVLGKKCDEVWECSSCDTPKCPLESILNGESLCEHEHEIKLLAAGGQKRHCIIVATPYHSVDGQVVGIVQSFTDITERKQSDEKLKESEERLALALDASNSGLWEFNPHTFADAHYNDRWFTMLGYEPDELPHTAETWTSLIHPEDFEQVQKELQDHIKGKSEYSAEFRMKTKFKDYRWIHSVGKIVSFDDAGHPQRMIGIHFDITDRKRAEEASREHVLFLESLGRIDKAIHGSTAPDQMLSEVIETVSQLFECDRSWLLYPGDPDAPSFSIPVESCSPEYPGGKILNFAIPTTPPMQGDMIEAINTDGPITCGPGNEKPVSDYTHTNFSVQSQMFMGIHPKIGKPWIFGIHQCSYARVWTDQEKRLFNEIGRRIADGLSSLLFFRDLKESEEKYRKLIETTSEGFWLISPERKTVDVNQSLCDMLGYSMSEMIGKNLFYFMDNENRKIFKEQIIQITSNVYKTYEISLKKKNGTYFPTLFNATPIVDKNGEITGTFAFVTDITERKQVEEALRVSEEQLKLILQHSSDGISIARYDLETGKRKLLMCNDRYVEMTGRSLEELMAVDDLQGFICYSASDKVQSQWRKRLENGKPCMGQAQWMRPDGKGNCYEWTATAVRAGERCFVIGVDRDITSREEVAGKLMAYQKQLRFLASELSLAEERERRRIAADLHDSIGQTLAFIQIKLEMIREEAIAAGLQDSLQEIGSIIEQTIKGIHSLIFELSPPVLHELGFEAAIEWLVEWVRCQHGLKCVFDTDERRAQIPISEDCRVVLFRAVRELLLNVVKHAQAQSAAIDIKQDDQFIRVSVRDDGNGFDTSTFGPDAKKASGFGLFNIYERLDYFGGRMEIESEIGRGSHFTLVLPLEQNCK